MNRMIMRLIGAAVLAFLAFKAAEMDITTRLTIALLIGIPAFVLMIVTRRQLGASFAVKPEAKTLVTKGLYSKIQHPLYFFLDLFLLSVIIATGWPTLIAVWGVLVISQTIRARQEEKVLSAAFGDEYTRYAGRTIF